MSSMNKSNLELKNWKFKEEVEKSTINKEGKVEDYNAIDTDIQGELSDGENTISSEKESVSLETKSNPFKQMMNQPTLGVNLAIATICWIACSFNYYLISYDIKNLGGNIFINSTIIAVAGVSGKLITLAVRKYTTSRNSLFICFIVVIIPGFGLVFFRSGWLVST